MCKSEFFTIILQKIVCKIVKQQIKDYQLCTKQRYLVWWEVLNGKGDLIRHPLSSLSLSLGCGVRLRSAQYTTPGTATTLHSYTRIQNIGLVQSGSNQLCWVQYWIFELCWARAEQREQRGTVDMFSPGSAARPPLVASQQQEPNFEQLTCQN